MRFVFYTHSLVSDWNHGNAHFLRGVMRDLVALGHDAVALEPEDGWSLRHLLAEHGQDAVERFRQAFPDLRTVPYGPGFDHAAALDGADVVIVHEWTDPRLIGAIGEIRRGADFALLFHDTHHRAVSAEEEMAAIPLQDYDGVLAFGEALRQRYLDLGWGRQVFTWHEAADDRLFRPMPEVSPEADLVWIGNWGDDERTAELDTFLIGPARRLGLTGRVHGVRYPDAAKARLARAGLTYAGWLPNAEAPAAFARHRVTVHVPRCPYTRMLPGIPTIRPFEALACGIPLVSAPWDDVEGLFRPGIDFLVAHDAGEMAAALRRILSDRDLAASLRENGLETIRARHTCRHRVDELFDILADIGTARARGMRRREAAE